MIPVARLFVLLGVLVVLAAAGCGGAERKGAAGSVVVRDSAGVEIVESAGPVWGEDDGWRVADAPVLRMGDLAASDDPSRQFYRVAFGVWLGPDRFAVTNLGTELRIYTLDGGLVRTLGGEGEGPGEFGFLIVVGRRNGELVLADAGETSPRRLTVMDTTGRVLETVRAAPGAWLRGDLVDDSTMVGRRYGFPGGPEDGRAHDTVVAVDVRTGEPRPLATTPGTPLAWTERQGRPFTSGSLRFGPASAVAGGHGRIVYGSGDRYELREVDASGTLLRIVRRPVAALPVTDELREPVLRRWREGGGDPLTRPQFADSVAHFLDLLVDDTDHLWVQRRAILGPHREWDVFDRGRRWLGTVVLPEELEVLAVSATHLLGVSTNELDIEIVEVYEIDKGTAARDD